MEITYKKIISDKKLEGIIIKVDQLLILIDNKELIGMEQPIINAKEYN